MDAQSKIIASVIVGLAIGASIAALLYSLKGDDNHHLQSKGSENSGAAFADEWSEMNDSLGG